VGITALIILVGAVFLCSRLSVRFSTPVASHTSTFRSLLTTAASYKWTNLRVFCIIHRTLCVEGFAHAIQTTNQYQFSIAHFKLFLTNLF